MGIRGKMYCILNSMYGSVKACVKSGNSISSYFECPNGVRQGCILSPLLFSFFIEELNTMLSKSGHMGIQLTQEFYNIFCLLYADDIVLFADSARNLQRLINILLQFCTKWNMAINLDKTKVVIFRKGGHRSSFGNWYFADSKIEIVSYYKYLGLLLSCRNSFSSKQAKP